jgi:predicted HicB family RNase H-like nuclease
MQENQLPRRKPPMEVMIGLRVDPEMKKQLEELKEKHNVDVPEWIRQMIQQGLEQLQAS